MNIGKKNLQDFLTEATKAQQESKKYPRRIDFDEKYGDCPHCGRCPTCGRRYNEYHYYPPYYWERPQWQIVPQITWTSNNIEMKY